MSRAAAHNTGWRERPARATRPQRELGPRRAELVPKLAPRRGNKRRGHSWGVGVHSAGADAPSRAAGGRFRPGLRRHSHRHQGHHPCRLPVGARLVGPVEGWSRARPFRHGSRPPSPHSPVGGHSMGSWWGALPKVRFDRGGKRRRPPCGARGLGELLRRFSKMSENRNGSPYRQMVQDLLQPYLGRKKKNQPTGRPVRPLALFAFGAGASARQGGILWNLKFGSG